jgi:hypothetical protein
MLDGASRAPDEYRLWIDAYSPETIPMERLAAYLASFAKLLGNQQSVHFSRVDGGSTATVAVVKKEAAPKVLARVESVGRGEAANDAIAAYRQINDLARGDNARARLIRVPALGTPITVLIFPGCDTPVEPTFGPFNDQAIIQGELVRIGGKDATAHVLVVDAEGRSWPGEVKKELAIRMARFLYHTVRLVGEARWQRTEDGTWKLLNLRITDFEPLSDETLDQGIAKLRALSDSDWATSKDIDGDIRCLRENEDGLH